MKMKPSRTSPRKTKCHIGSEIIYKLRNRNVREARKVKCMKRGAAKLKSSTTVSEFNTVCCAELHVKKQTVLEHAEKNAPKSHSADAKLKTKSIVGLDFGKARKEKAGRKHEKPTHEPHMKQTHEPPTSVCTPCSVANVKEGCISAIKYPTESMSSVSDSVLCNGILKQHISAKTVADVKHAKQTEEVFCSSPDYDAHTVRKTPDKIIENANKYRKTEIIKPSDQEETAAHIKDAKQTEEVLCSSPDNDARIVRKMLDKIIENADKYRKTEVIKPSDSEETAAHIKDAKQTEEVLCSSPDNEAHIVRKMLDKIIESANKYRKTEIIKPSNSKENGTNFMHSNFSSKAISAANAVATQNESKIVNKNKLGIKTNDFRSFQYGKECASEDTDGRVICKPKNNCKTSLPTASERSVVVKERALHEMSFSGSPSFNNNIFFKSDVSLAESHPGSPLQSSIADQNITGIKKPKKTHSVFEDSVNFSSDLRVKKSLNRKTYSRFQNGNSQITDQWLNLKSPNTSTTVTDITSDKSESNLKLKKHISSPNSINNSTSVLTDWENNNDLPFLNSSFVTEVCDGNLKTALNTLPSFAELCEGGTFKTDNQQSSSGITDEVSDSSVSVTEGNTFSSQNGLDVTHREPLYQMDDQESTEISFHHHTGDVNLIKMMYPECSEEVVERVYNLCSKSLPVSVCVLNRLKEINMLISKEVHLETCVGDHGGKCNCLLKLHDKLCHLSFDFLESETEDP